MFLQRKFNNLFECEFYGIELFSYSLKIGITNLDIKYELTQ